MQSDTPENETRKGPKGVYEAALIPRIAELAELGLPQTLIARALGIRPETFSKWLKKHEDLGEAVEQAKIRGAIDRLQKIRDARDKNGNPVWQASAWTLQRMFPGEFAQPDTKVDVHNTTNLSVTVVTADRLRQLQGRREAALRGGHGSN